MSFITGPTPPDPAASASAQTSTNISTALANSFLNNPNQATQQGSLTYTPSGDSITLNDPEKPGVSYTIPRYLATQRLSPNQLELSNQREGAQIGLATTANTQAARLNDYLGGNVNTSGAPALGDPNTIGSILGPASTFGDAGQQQTGISGYGTPLMSFADVGSQQGQFGDAGTIARDYGPNDFSADRSRVEQSLFERLNPQLNRDRSRLEQQLNDQGIRYGSPAYAQAMDDFNRQSTDARLAVTAQGGVEQRLQADLAAQRAGFANAAQQQAYLQAQGRGAFANTAQQAAYQQALGRGQFGQQGQQTLFEQIAGAGQFVNAAQAAAFQQAQSRGQFANATLAQQLSQRQAALNAQNQTRNQYLAELYATRNQPINEISALLSGSQLSQPQWANWNQAQIPTTDIAGLINQNFAQQSANAQMQSQLLGNVIGAAGKVGGAVLSDQTMKEDIHRIGSVLATNPVDVPMTAIFSDNSDRTRELPIYSYSYKDDPASRRHVGPMAQDVEKVDPHAVVTHRGKKYVKAETMGSILRAA